MKITLFYDHVTVLDYAYLDEHQGAVGHSLIVDVEFLGKTDHEGVVYDFSYAKKKVKEIIDRDCDHRLVVPHKLMAKEGEKISFTYSYGLQTSNVIEYSAPAQAVCEIPFTHVSEENLKTYLESTILKEMPETVIAIKLKFRAENLPEKSFFHYTHGLRDHYGNCQRLLHGHRSTISVSVNGKVRSDIEEDLVQNQFSSNIHLCYWDNVVNKDEILKALKSHYNSTETIPSGRFALLPPIKIFYKSAQGEFLATLPSSAVYFMPLETTVENISIHFARVVKSKVKPEDLVQVKAFEGIAKGAVSTL